MEKSGTTVEYKYNHDGLRVQKKTGSTTTDYTLHGKLITHMKQGSANLHFYYDAQSRPAMVKYESGYYTYMHNVQGDIIGLVDTNNALVVEYRYDAWGRILSATGSMAATLGKLNPFRYRGYVYDEETGLYYLRSRYYNPLWGRFINADEILGQTGAIFSHNLYIYCVNNPTIFGDAEGQLPKWLAAAAIIAVSVVAVAIVIAAAPAVAGVVSATAVYYGASATVASSFAWGATVACTTVAAGEALIGVNRAAELITGTNYGAKIIGEQAYNSLETATHMAAGAISIVPQTSGYPKTGRGARDLREQLAVKSVQSAPRAKEVIIRSLRDPRMPGYLGWEKRSATYKVMGGSHRIEIHYVTNRFIPWVSYDYKIKSNTYSPY